MSLASTVDEVVSALAAAGGEPRAGGTDVAARRRCLRATGPFVDLRGVAALRGITWRADGGARVGATTLVAALADDERLRAAYPGLALVAGAVATPEVRASATLGGNLLQRNRCWYYRNPAFTCYQSGGDTCPARDGVNLYSVVVDQGPCIAPHPSSLAMALLAYDAAVEVHGRGVLAVADLYGDGSDPTRDHLLGDGEVLVGVDLPAPVAERVAYRRVTDGAGTQWPLVEVLVRLVVSGDTVASAAVAAGGIARTPLRLAEVEAALVGRGAGDAEALRAAADRATAGCAPLPQTGYKTGLLRDTVLDTLDRALTTP